MKVLYVSSKGSIHDYRFLKKLSEKYDVLFLHYAADEIIPEIKGIKNIRIISKKPIFKSFPLASEIFHFKKVLKEFRPDVIHTGYAWQVGVLAALVNVHPHLSMPWGSDILTEPDRSFFKKWLVKKVMRQCDHIQCDAEYVKAKIMEDYNIVADRITVFPWGIDLNIFRRLDKNKCREKLNIDKNKFVLIFNRHLEPVYGVDVLLEAYKIFASEKQDVQLLMLSDGSLKSKVMKFISDNRLENKLSLIGRVPNSELPVFLNAADVYISPSSSDGSSLSLLEAMACGLGIIVTAVPAIKEWINSGNGLVTSLKDPADLSDAMERYYKNRELVNIHGTKNIEIATHRADWDKNFQMLCEIYSSINKKYSPR
ncbi:MAG: glycosyltransferase [Ignavibacteria bacterium]|nr:glycosyltransferase [Ignavibacteria bacterium]